MISCVAPRKLPPSYSHTMGHGKITKSSLVRGTEHLKYREITNRYKRWSIVDSVEQVVNEYKLCQSLLEISKIDPYHMGELTLESILGEDREKFGSTLSTISGFSLFGKRQKETVLLRDKTQMASIRLSGDDRKERRTTIAISGEKAYKHLRFVEDDKQRSCPVSRSIEKIPGCQDKDKKIIPTGKSAPGTKEEASLKMGLKTPRDSRDNMDNGRKNIAIADTRGGRAISDMELLTKKDGKRKTVSIPAELSTIHENTAVINSETKKTKSFPSVIQGESEKKIDKAEKRRSVVIPNEKDFGNDVDGQSTLARKHSDKTPNLPFIPPQISAVNEQGKKKRCHTQKKEKKEKKNDNKEDKRHKNRKKSKSQDSERKREGKHPQGSDYPRSIVSKQGPHMTNSKPQSGCADQENKKKGISVVDVRDVKMLAKATRVLQEHVKDMTEKTKSTCCVGKQVMKENLIYNNNLHNATEPVHYVTDKIRGITYIKGKLLGKGGFAKCYELTDISTGKTYAGKIISKNRIAKPHQKEKIAREVEVHRNLRNVHVVGFHSYFEDDDNVYIILEICSRKSLVHVLRNRKTVTEPECRFYLKQLIEGTKYIHSQNIIHRDLKLGNMLLNEGMNIKIADFGLATKVEYEGEKKTTVCGTPNYIAPEVLQKKGHSYEVDIWALGCVMYALLVGRPPFETSTLKETYMRITSNKYHIPSSLSAPARNLIQKLLNPEPSLRPSLDKILEDEFLTAGYIPSTLPTTCCESAPKFNLVSSRPKSYAAPVSPSDAMHKITSSLAQLKGSRRRSTTPSPVRGVAKSAEDVRGPSSHPMLRGREPSATRTASTPSVTVSEPPKRQPTSGEMKALPYGSAVRLYQMLTTCTEQMPEDANPSPVHNVKPLWVTKWVDYSNKYGFGFQLSDKSVGVLFNDTTRMLLTADGKTIQYNDLSNKVFTIDSKKTPREYWKKSTLLVYFAQYMNEHLIHGGDILQHRNVVNEANCIFMKKWFRTQKAIVMYLNNGTLQVNFFDDHTKVVLSPDDQDYLVTFINSNRQAVTFRLLQLRHFGCHPDIKERLAYARTMLESIINIEGEAV